MRPLSSTSRPAAALVLAAVATLAALAAPACIPVRRRACATRSEAGADHADSAEHAAQPAPAIQVELSAVEAAVVQASNEARAQHALSPLAVEAALMAAARGHAVSMARHRKMAHRLAGTEPADRVRAAGYHYRATGENIAVGQESAAEVTAAWMASPGHRANILSSDFTQIGVAGHTDRATGRIYWVQNFGAPMVSVPAGYASPAPAPPRCAAHARAPAAPVSAPEPRDFIARKWFFCACAAASGGTASGRVCAANTLGAEITAAHCFRERRRPRGSITCDCHTTPDAKPCARSSGDRCAGF